MIEVQYSLAAFSKKIKKNVNKNLKNNWSENLEKPVRFLDCIIFFFKEIVVAVYLYMYLLVFIKIS